MTTGELRSHWQGVMAAVHRALEQGGAQPSGGASRMLTELMQ
jgi:hypothetical protein